VGEGRRKEKNLEEKKRKEDKKIHVLEAIAPIDALSSEFRRRRRRGRRGKRRKKESTGRSY